MPLSYPRRNIRRVLTALTLLFVGAYAWVGISNGSNELQRLDTVNREQIGNIVVYLSADGQLPSLQDIRREVMEGRTTNSWTGEPLDVFESNETGNPLADLPAGNCGYFCRQLPDGFNRITIFSYDGDGEVTGTSSRLITTHS